MDFRRFAATPGWMAGARRAGWPGSLAWLGWLLGGQKWGGFPDLEIGAELEDGDGVYPPQLLP